MSSDAIPISPARFAEAIKDLPLSSLHLKVLELRNSIAHLDYSNEQLRPFAEGREAIGGGGGAGQPDQDCAEAIAENEAVISRMQERIRLVRVEVEGRGVGWEEFQSKEEAEAEAEARQQGLVNGETNGHASDDEHSAWADGTFQTGTIRNGEIHMDAPARPHRAATTGAAPGGTLTDEELRRRLEQQLGPLDGEAEDDEDGGGVHL
jgi:hypothetical protein